MTTSPRVIDMRAVENALEKYYLSSGTAGRGEYVQGTIFSKGRGIGSIIRAVVKAAAPLARKVGRAIKPIAKKTGRYILNRGVEAAADIATDMLSGVPPQEAFHRNASRTLENAKFDALQKLKGVKRKQSTKKAPRAKKYKKRTNF